MKSDTYVVALEIIIIILLLYSYIKMRETYMGGYGWPHQLYDSGAIMRRLGSILTSTNQRPYSIVHNIEKREITDMQKLAELQKKANVQI